MEIGDQMRGFVAVMLSSAIVSFETDHFSKSGRTISRHAD